MDDSVKLHKSQIKLASVLKNKKAIIKVGYLQKQSKYLKIWKK